MRKVILFVSLGLHALIANSQDATKLEAALRLHNAMMVADAPNLVDSVILALSAQFGGELPPEIQSEFELIVTEIVESDEYVNAKAQIYAQYLSLEVIDAMTEMVESPEYLQYTDVLRPITDASGQLMGRLMAAKQPEIQERLEAVGVQLVDP